MGKRIDSFLGRRTRRREKKKTIERDLEETSESQEANSQEGEHLRDAQGGDSGKNQVRSDGRQEASHIFGIPPGCRLVERVGRVPRMALDSVELITGGETETVALFSRA